MWAVDTEVASRAVADKCSEVVPWAAANEPWAIKDGIAFTHNRRARNKNSIKWHGTSEALASTGPEPVQQLNVNYIWNYH